MRLSTDRALIRCATLMLLALSGIASAAESASCPQLNYGGGFSPSSSDRHVLIQADRADAALDQRGLSTLSGSVHVSQNDRQFSSSQLDYDQTTQHLLLNHSSLFRTPRLIIKSGSGDFDLANETGFFNESQFTLPTRASRGSARRVDLNRSGTVDLYDAHYTTCGPGDDAWMIQAAHLHLDRKSGIGTAHNATLQLGGVPVMWFPYLRFPIDGRRRTGLLFPTFGEGNKTGFDARIPLYLNLAPNFDDTFTPRLMTQRGVQLDNRFRYLFERNRGSFEYQYLNQDQVTGHERSFIHLQQEGLLADHLSFDVNFAQVSDLNYFNDLGGYYSDSNLAYSTTPYLPREATLTYHGEAPYTLQVLAESYQPLTIINNLSERPYTRLPEIRFTGITANSLANVRAGIEADATNFERKNSIQGQRLYLDPYLRWDIDRTGWFASSRIDGTYTQYALSGPVNGAPQNPHRVLPEFSVGGGLRFDRTTGGGMLQTIEPRLFYLYVPYTDQSQLPVFDTGLPDFNFPALFARNLYTGEDRIANANQLTTVLTTRLLDPKTGLQRLTASFGQIYRFTSPKVGLPGVDLPSAGTSDFVANFDYLVSRHWGVRSAAQWSPSGNAFTRGMADVSYRGASALRIDLAYHYQRGLYNQADLSFIAPISDRWRVAGRLIYSIRDASSLESFGGVEYETCCWAVRAGISRYITSVQGTFSTGFLIQFTLKGLSSLGHGWAGLLPVDDSGLGSLRRAQ